MQGQHIPAQPPQITSNAITVGQTARAVSAHLTQNLAGFRIIPTEVTGFTEFNFLGYPCRSPIQLQNLVGPKFWRSFDPSLQSALNELKTSNEIDKSQLHATLLKKYFEQDLESGQITLSNKPNAYQALPKEDSEDYQLQLYFLQPFRLFGISDNNRKFVGTDVATMNREWLWHPNARDNDSAPLFRSIIQVYILASIIEDCEDNTQQAFHSPEILAKLDALKALHAQLLTYIDRHTRSLFNAIERPTAISSSHMRGTPQGFFSDSGLLRVIDNQFHGFMDVMGYYPAGRLLFGQPTQEPHYASATNENREAGNAPQSTWRFVLSWVITHLNISTSVFWLQKVLNILIEQWTTFKEFVNRTGQGTDGRQGFIKLLIQSLLFVPNAFILAAAPLLILLPGIYGITSMPFSLLRNWFMHGRYDSLREYKWLKWLDALEFIKDFVLFIWFAVPVLNLIIDGLILMVPTVLLAPGYAVGLVVSSALIITTLAIIGARDIPVDLLTGVANLNFTQLVGTSVFASVGAYLGLGVAMRGLLPLIPQALKNGVAFVFSPLNRLVAPLERMVRYVAGEQNRAIDTANIIPTVNRQPGIDIPKPTVQLVIPQALSNEIDQLFSALGKLNQAFNLSEDRRKLIRDCIGALDKNTATSLEALNNAVLNAKNLLENNFSQQEAQTMTTLITYLREHEVALDNRENTAIRVQGNAGTYQPSWTMLKTLHEQGIIRQDGTWNAPNGIDVPSSLQDKCRRIEGLKPN